MENDKELVQYINEILSDQNLKIINLEDYSDYGIKYKYAIVESDFNEKELEDYFNEDHIEDDIKAQFSLKNLKKIKEFWELMN